MNINKAFREGKLNCALYEILVNYVIGEEVAESVSMRCFFLRNRLLSLSLSFNFFVLCVVSVLEDNLPFLLVFFFLSCFFFAGYIYGFVQNFRFERLYKKFVNYLDVPFRSMSYCRNLNLKVCETLRRLAQDLVCLEESYERMSPEVSGARKKLADAHAFFLKLGLCEEDWGTYFEKAEESAKQE